MRRSLVGVATLALLTGALVPARAAAPATPIEHLVVIYQENESFDHYFGTYPKSKNPKGEPKFTAAAGTPKVNGLTKALLTHNPNLANPFRLDRSQALTCDMGHSYTAEQRAFDQGAMDRFVQETGNHAKGCLKNAVMGYFDGNTVTAMWNYAQHFAMSDRFFGTGFGPSTVGAINLVSGQTHGASPDSGDTVVNGTMIGDPDPAYDDCATGTTRATMNGQNVGDLLNNAGVTWGWFEGGFRPTGTDQNGAAVCGSAHKNIAGKKFTDYVPHHEPFQYYASTANPHHLPPTSANAIGQTDQANHQCDLSDFWTAANAGAMPAVSFLKAPHYEDGHPGDSDPLDEQRFLVQTINRLQTLPEWSSTAVLIAWDDSDGWYDHVMGPLVSPSSDAHDALTGPGGCGSPGPGAYQDRCGYGPRLPFLVISRYARANFVSHTTADQTSILRFIEDNWGLGQIGDQSLDARAGALDGLFDFAHPRPAGARFLLSPTTGEPR